MFVTNLSLREYDINVVYSSNIVQEMSTTGWVKSNSLL
jgi:hypothetical protein